MHELSVARHLIDLARENAGGAQVLALHVRVGTQSCVAPEALEFCFEVAASQTPLAGARLEFESVEGRDLQLVWLEVA